MPLDRAEEVFKHFQEHIRMFWPAEITVRHQNTQMGAYISTTGGFWMPGDTVHLYADGISWHNNGQQLAIDSVTADAEGNISSTVDQRFEETPRDRWTPVTIRAEDDDGRKATAPGPDSAFYIWFP
jgi:hypothetical protein